MKATHETNIFSQADLRSTTKDANLGMKTPSPETATDPSVNQHRDLNAHPIIKQEQTQQPSKTMEETFADPDINHTDDKTSPVPLRDKAGKLASEAGATAQKIKESAVEKAGQIRDYAETKAHTIKETASEKSHHIKQVANEQIQQGQVKAREAHAGAEEYIRQNPTKSVLTALGVGFLVGLIVRK